MVLVPFPFTDQSRDEETPCRRRLGLIKASMLKPVFTTIDRGLVIRTIGALSAADAKTLREVLADVIG